MTSSNPCNFNHVKNLKAQWRHKISALTSLNVETLFPKQDFWVKTKTGYNFIKCRVYRDSEFLWALCFFFTNVAYFGVIYSEYFGSTKLK